MNASQKPDLMDYLPPGVRPPSSLLPQWGLDLPGSQPSAPETGILGSKT
ncbi:hypothetical protein [Nostoc sp. CCY0012]